MPGSYRLDWHGEDVIAAAGRGKERGLRNAGEHLLVESQREVPLREGILLNSGRVEVTRGGVGVLYDTEYAEVQHEREDYQHPNGRKDHYLSDPAEREGATMRALVAAAIRSAVGGAGGGRRRR